MKNLPIGTTGTAARDFEILFTAIKKGARVRIVDVDPTKGYSLADEHGNLVTDRGFDCIIPDRKE